MRKIFNQPPPPNISEHSKKCPFYWSVPSFMYPRGPLAFQAGYHPRKRTFKTQTLNTRFACVFLNLSVMSFENLSIWQKNTPFFPILHVFTPLNDVRAYIAWSWKTTLITWIFFFYEDGIQLQIHLPPPPACTWSVIPGCDLEHEIIIILSFSTILLRLY